MGFYDEELRKLRTMNLLCEINENLIRIVTILEAIVPAPKSEPITTGAENHNVEKG